MKIAVSITLFNPKDVNFEYYNEYSKYFDMVYFIDNSIKSNDYLKTLVSKKKVRFISNNDNLGIGSALNKALSMAKMDGIDILLTMDQDSFFPFDKLNEIKDILNKYFHSNYAILGMNLNHTFEGNEIINKEWVITSGNFIYLNKIGDIKFNEKLFIDCVDTEFCVNLAKKSLKVGYFCNYFIKHTIGNPSYINLLFCKIKKFNYNPLRYYYIFRNITYLFRIDKNRVYSKLFYKTRILWFFEILFFEKNKKKNLKAIKLGIQDGKRAKLGKCVYNF